MGNRTWLDALYNDSHRDDIIKAYILSYFNDKNLSIQKVKYAKNDKNEPMLDVLYVTDSYYHPQLGCICTSSLPLEVHLYIGEYFRYEQSNNIVDIVENLPKEFEHFKGKRFQVSVDEPPTYIFNEVSSIAKYHDKNGRGSNTHHIMKILEMLNGNNTINHETFFEMLKKRNSRLMAEQIEKDKAEGIDNSDAYKRWFDSYFEVRKNPLTQYRKLYDKYFDLPIL